jgi:hypothetical protein
MGPGIETYLFRYKEVMISVDVVTLEYFYLFMIYVKMLSVTQLCRANNLTLSPREIPLLSIVSGKTSDKIFMASRATRGE